jgi:hypothetical protein
MTKCILPSSTGNFLGGSMLPAPNGQLAALDSDPHPKGRHWAVFSFAPVASPPQCLGDRFIPVLFVDDPCQIANALTGGDHEEATTRVVAASGLQLTGSPGAD